MDPDNVKVYDHKTDLEFSRSLNSIRKTVTHDKGKYLFDPQTFKGQEFGNSLEAHKLSEEDLIKYGMLVTKVREKFKIKADLIRRFESDH